MAKKKKPNKQKKRFMATNANEYISNLQHEMNKLRGIAEFNVNKDDPERYKRELKKRFERMIPERIQDVRENTDFDLDTIKLEQYAQKRRVSAASEYAVKADEKFGDKFEGTDAARMFGLIAMENTNGYPDIYENLTWKYDEECDPLMSLACAIYILDDLSMSGKIDEALPLIPCEEELINEIKLPDDFSDACYENELLQGMMYLILHRCDGYAPEDSFPYLNSFTAKLNVRRPVFDGEKLTYWERYSRILDMVASKGKAAKTFEDDMWRLSEIYLDFIHKYQPYAKELYDKSLEHLNTLIKATNRVEEIKKIEKYSNPIINSSCIIGSYSTSSDWQGKHSKEYTQLMKVLEDVSEEGCKTEITLYEYGAYVKGVIEATYPLSEVVSLKYKYLKKDSDRSEEDPPDTYYMYEELENEFFDKIQNFSITDPYETCFAYLYLTDMGSDIPWLGVLPAMLVSIYADSKLPWTNVAAAPLLNEGEIKVTNESINEINELEALMYDKSQFYAGESRKEAKSSMNLHQILYGQTGVNPPRKLFQLVDSLSVYENVGLKKEEIPLYSVCASAMIYATARRGFIKEETETEVVEIVDEEALNEKDKEIEELKAALYKTESALRGRTEELEQALAEKEEERKERVELQDALYNMQNQTDVEVLKEEDDEEDYPYTPKERVVIYGGHDTWLKVIRQKLPTVRIIDPFTKPDANTIRNADVIWLQTNAMPHTHFYKIIDIARQRKIKVKYFEYASVEKCVRQLVNYDKSL